MTLIYSYTADLLISDAVCSVTVLSVVPDTLTDLLFNLENCHYRYLLRSQIINNRSVTF
jgi:hypothetical protein